MNFKYVPVLKNRIAEKEALQNQIVSNKVLPLIEMVIEKPRVASQGDFATSHESFFKDIKSPSILVDIPMYLHLSDKTLETVYNFIGPIYRDPIIKVNYLNLLTKIKDKNVIPVISYSPNNYFDTIIVQQRKLLDKSFKTVAYRVFLENFNEAIEEIKLCVKPADIVILDIGEVPHTGRTLKNFYNKLHDLKKTHNCFNVLIRSALPSTLKNTELIDGKYIDAADNSLIDYYENYNFDAFGDCAGIKRTEIDDIPVSSPAYVYYYRDDNVYVGFKGEYKKISSFESLVLPKYSKSDFWKKISPTHKEKCYGCNMVSNMISGVQSSNSATKWKTITISHYLKSIDENL